MSLFIGAILVGIVSLPISTFMLRLKAGEFAIGMWVVAEPSRTFWSTSMA